MDVFNDFQSQNVAKIGEYSNEEDYIKSQTEPVRRSEVGIPKFLFEIENDSNSNFPRFQLASE